MSRATTGYHVRLRPEALPVLRSVYGLTEEEAVALWAVEVVDGGYENRDGLHLVSPEGRRLLAWRSQVQPEPRCEYCGLEGHQTSRGTAKTCPRARPGRCGVA
jgi:hypothetical protein